MQGFAPHPTSFGAPKKQKGYILVLFSTNFIFALFATFCGGKKLNKKIDKLKNF